MQEQRGVEAVLPFWRRITMCGLVAWYPTHAAVDAELLRSSINRLHHRGPDAQRVWVSDDRSIGLAHARLSIIGMNELPQPIGNENGTVQAVVNGEFYDFERIRRELEGRGHRFPPAQTARYWCIFTKRTA